MRGCEYPDSSRRVLQAIRKGADPSDGVHIAGTWFRIPGRSGNLEEPDRTTARRRLALPTQDDTPFLIRARRGVP
jgi:hypothetical protein